MLCMFRQERGIEVKLEDMEFVVVDRLFAEGERYVEELETEGRRESRRPAD